MYKVFEIAKKNEVEIVIGGGFVVKTISHQFGFGTSVFGTDIDFFVDDLEKCKLSIFQFDSLLFFFFFISSKINIDCYCYLLPPLFDLFFS